MLVRGGAVKDGLDEHGRVLYKKVETTPKPRLVKVKKLEQVDLDELAIGRSIMSLLNTFTTEIKSLRQEHKDLLVENTELKQLMNEKDKRLLEMSERLNSRKKQSVKLSDLQAIVSDK